VLYFYLLEKEKRRKEKKNNPSGKEGFPRAGPALLAVQQVTAVKYS
jgi:hypothetical protein